MFGFVFHRSLDEHGVLFNRLDLGISGTPLRQKPRYNCKGKQSGTAMYDMRYHNKKRTEQELTNRIICWIPFISITWLSWPICLDPLPFQNTVGSWELVCRWKSTHGFSYYVALSTNARLPYSPTRYQRPFTCPGLSFDVLSTLLLWSPLCNWQSSALVKPINCFIGPWFSCQCTLFCVCWTWSGPTTFSCPLSRRGWPRMDRKWPCRMDCKTVCTDWIMNHDPLVFVCVLCLVVVNGWKIWWTDFTARHYGFASSPIRVWPTRVSCGSAAKLPSTDRINTSLVAPSCLEI